MSAAQSIGHEEFDILGEARKLCGPRATTPARGGKGRVQWHPKGQKQRLEQQARWQARVDFVEGMMARDLWETPYIKVLGALWAPDARPKWQRNYIRKISSIAHTRVMACFDKEAVRRKVMVRTETIARENMRSHPRIALRANELEARIAGLMHGSAHDFQAPMVTTNIALVQGAEGKALRIGSMTSLFRGREPKALPETVEMEKGSEP